MRLFTSESLPIRMRQLALAYFNAKSVVVEAGYADEVDWQYTVSLKKVNEQTLLREAAWVILCSGMRERTIRNKFQDISRAFLCWESAQAITTNVETCKVAALNYFKHPAKVNAIIKVAFHIDRDGFAKVMDNIEKEGTAYLQRL